MKRSDLICENGVINAKENTKIVHNFTLYRTNCTEIRVNEDQAKRSGLECGRYVTIYCDNENYPEALKAIISDFLPNGKAFVAGLGNERVCSDSLGPKTLRYVPATAHLTTIEQLKEIKMREVYVIGTSVTGKTGIESTEQVTWLSEKVGAEFIVVIDSLACSEPERLCRTIQITDTGIAPGSGVGNNRKALNERTTGKKVIAIGVPTVIDYENGMRNFMVTPRNIDAEIDEFSRNIGLSLSRALNPNLIDEEIRALII